MIANPARLDVVRAEMARRSAPAQVDAGRPQRFYRSADVAKAFGVTQQTVRMWVRRGALQGTKVGGIFLLDADAVDRRLRGIVGAIAPDSGPASLASDEPAYPWDPEAVLVVECVARMADAAATGGRPAALDAEEASVGGLPFREVLATVAAPDSEVEVDPRRLHGSPCIQGTRIPVSLVLHYLAEGRTVRKILADFPSLSREQVLGAVDYAARLLEQPVD